jgi:pimeloyl-ACP methyl ester carboxylesterase
MKSFKACLAIATALSLSTAVPASAEPLKNIVLVHGAWVDASGWKPVYEILTKEDFKVSMVQEPETSFADDVAATKRVLDLQDGPTLLVGHSYGGSIITQAGVHPRVVGLVYVAAHAPDVGEDEAALGKKTPSVLAKTMGAIKKTPDGRPICRASAQNSRQGLRSWPPPRCSARRLPQPPGRRSRAGESSPGTIRSSTPISSAGTTPVPRVTRPKSMAPATPYTNRIQARSRL